MLGTSLWGVVMFSKGHLLGVWENAKAAAPYRFWGKATALCFFLIGGFLLTAGDKLGHTGEFLFADHALIPEIPVEVVQPQILGYAPLPLAVGYGFLHAVTPFCILLSAQWRRVIP